MAATIPHLQFITIFGNNKNDSWAIRKRRNLESSSGMYKSPDPPLFGRAQNICWTSSMGKPNKRAPILYHTQLPLRLGRWSDSLSNVCTRSMSRQLRVVLQWPLTRVAFVLSWYESHRPTVSEMPGQASVSRTCLLSVAYLTVTTESVTSESNEVLFTRLGWRWLSTAMFCVVFPWACLWCWLWTFQNDKNTVQRKARIQCCDDMENQEIRWHRSRCSISKRNADKRHDADTIRTLESKS